MQYSGNFTIKKWAEEDRPREKLQLKGRSSLTDAELVAILLGSGHTNLSALDLAKQLLSSVNYDLNNLGKLSIDEYTKLKGIGPAKAITLIAALELGRRRRTSSKTNTLKITGSNEVFDMMHPLLSDLDHEEFWVIFINRANIVIRKERFSAGGISGTVVDSRLIFKRAMELLASSIVLVHNHPSGNTRPSNADKQLTRKIKEAGQLLDLSLIHI